MYLNHTSFDNIKLKFIRTPAGIFLSLPDNVPRPYVYKVIFSNNEYYYGYHETNATCFNIPAHLDIGIKYFTSSDIIKERIKKQCKGWTIKK